MEILLNDSLRKYKLGKILKYSGKQKFGSNNDSSEYILGTMEIW